MYGFVTILGVFWGRILYVLRCFSVFVWLYFNVGGRTKTLINEVYRCRYYVCVVFSRVHRVWGDRWSCLMTTLPLQSLPLPGPVLDSTLVWL